MVGRTRRASLFAGGGQWLCRVAGYDCAPFRAHACRGRRWLFPFASLCLFPLGRPSGKQGGAAASHHLFSPLGGGSGTTPGSRCAAECQGSSLSPLVGKGGPRPRIVGGFPGGP